MQHSDASNRQAIEKLCRDAEISFHTIIKLPQQGSDRIYYRVLGKVHNCIATYGSNIKENKSFIYMSRHFKKAGLPVPQILAVSKDGQYYLQQDFGDRSLLHCLEAEGYTEKIKDLYKTALTKLAQLQVKGNDGFDYTQVLTSKEFGKEAILADLLYFKYYFLDLLKEPYDKQDLLQDFENLAEAMQGGLRYFMFRDFQSRNIMVDDDDEIYFIDYQGGMLGAPHYDVASLLWQAKAALPAGWKDELLQHYIQSLTELVETELDKIAFAKQYEAYVLVRLLQVMGAYGFRGLIEKKSHFVNSIPQGLQNINSFLQGSNMLQQYPTLNKVLQYCSSAQVTRQFANPTAGHDSKLIVYINSFSYLKNGYPPDASSNGGGFVFDCRGILNPGRIDEYKCQSGEDKPVQEYLEQHTQMNDFLQSVFALADITVANYLQRDFESLMFNFGCTGGQHRSVYGANALARHLKNKFGVQVQVQHLNRHNWKKTL